MNKIKIGYFADGPWSHKAFERLIQNEWISFEFIVPRFDTQDFTLKSFAEKYNIKYIKTANINSQEFIEKVQKFDCDLFISLSFNQIFKKEIINIPRLKSVNIHAGKLPFYRGRNVLNWAIINGETEFGVTAHFIDEGIDTGDIILQNIYPITIDDDYNSILHKAFDYCAETLEITVKKFLSPVVIGIKQSSIHPIGFYCGGRQKGDEKLNWDQNSLQVFNFVRAICQPSGPGALTSIGLEKFIINKVKMISQAPVYLGIPGQIIGKNGKNLIVKTKDSFLEITQYTSSLRPKIGDRFD
jgi:methionyl-tRNA formyltransferase